MIVNTACEISRKQPIEPNSYPWATPPRYPPPVAAPTPDEVRTALAHFDKRRQKIVAGLFTVMAQNAPKVRDREWVSQHLAEITVLAGDFEADSPQDGVSAVETFLKEHGEEILTATLLLFQRVGLDLAPRAQKGFELEEALDVALGYLPD